MIKKRKSFTQATTIFSCPAYKEFSDEYFGMTTQLDSLKVERERLMKVEQDYHRLVQTFKSYVDDGSKTTIHCSAITITERTLTEKMISLPLVKKISTSSKLIHRMHSIKLTSIL